MQRRNFLKHTSVAGLVFSPFLNASSNIAAEKNVSANNTDNFELGEATIDTLQQAMQSGKNTSKKITELYLKRIEAIDKNGPALNAVIEINPDALKIAADMDAERKAGKVRGPMHGIPVNKR